MRSIEKHRTIKKQSSPTAATLELSKASVTSYLPYKKGVYFPNTEKEKISIGAERQRRYRSMKRWKADPTERKFTLGGGWCVAWTSLGVKFKTYSRVTIYLRSAKGKEWRVHERVVD